eukprot:371840_1
MTCRNISPETGGIVAGLFASFVVVVTCAVVFGRTQCVPINTITYKEGWSVNLVTDHDMKLCNGWFGTKCAINCSIFDTYPNNAPAVCKELDGNHVWVGKAKSGSDVVLSQPGALNSMDGADYGSICIAARAEA